MRLHSLIFAALAAAACSPNGTPSQPEAPGVRISRIQVDSVTIRTAQSFPVQVFAQVKGVIGDGCSELQPLQQSRAGNVVTLEITRARPENAICTQIAKLFDQQVRLEGEFRTGDYTLAVNGTAYPFRVD
jgi:hypothetical protein